MIKEFKDFLMRGNVIDLAGAVVIGAAFGALVTSLVTDLLTPIIVGKPDSSDLTFTINGSVFRYGNFINALIAFVSIAAAVFFFVVKPINAINRARGVDPAEDKSETELLGEILEELRKGTAR